MSTTESGELVELVDQLRQELAAAVDELDRARDAHRRVESLLLALLEHVPVPLVVVDRELRVRAATAAAEGAWGADLDRPLSALEGLDAGVVAACRTGVEQGIVRPGDVPDGYGVALLSEPGTGERYATAWATGRARPAGTAG